MNLSNAFRLQAEHTCKLSVGDIFLAYTITVFLVPSITAGVTLIAIPAFEPENLELFIVARNYILHSGLISWCVAPIAVPIAWKASRLGWIGWATAGALGLIGGLMGAFALQFLMRDDIIGDYYLFLILHLPQGLGFALLFWFLLRLIRPEAFAGKGK